jgi:hypothetical protein
MADTLITWRLTTITHYWYPSHYYLLSSITPFPIYIRGYIGWSLNKSKKILQIRGRKSNNPLQIPKEKGQSDNDLEITTRIRWAKRTPLKSMMWTQYSGRVGRSYVIGSIHRITFVKISSDNHAWGFVTTMWRI